MSSTSIDTIPPLSTDYEIPTSCVGRRFRRPVPFVPANMAAPGGPGGEVDVDEMCPGTLSEPVIEG
ncbi:hypothetical protein HK102_002493 [Quaeritorhiza haematococci]|nr:hypothetical protein HK102_002493 [Quaeritorhiza haematococci]